jgi:hypothetical protein
MARIGHWASLDARVKTTVDSEYGIMSHNVEFELINQYGDHLRLGFFIISEAHWRIWDEDGTVFPSVDAAIRAKADDVLRITPMPGRPVRTPPRHDLWQGTVGTAFQLPAHA